MGLTERNSNTGELFPKMIVVRLNIFLFCVDYFPFDEIEHPLTPTRPSPVGAFFLSPQHVELYYREAREPALVLDKPQQWCAPPCIQTQYLKSMISREKALAEIEIKEQ